MALSTRRVLAESTPIALVLLVWGILSAFATANPTIQFAVQLGGVAMAVLYAVVRGVALSTEAEPAYERQDAESVLVENGRAMLAGGPWFVLALVASAFSRHVFGLGLPLSGPGGPLPRTMDGLALVFAFSGTITVLLVVIATGVRSVRSVRTL